MFIVFSFCILGYVYIVTALPYIVINNNPFIVPVHAYFTAISIEFVGDAVIVSLYVMVSNIVYGKTNNI